MDHTVEIRVRYSEIDQLGTVYNSRVLEWFEVGRGELLRAMGLPYSDMEARGAHLPLVVAHVDYINRAGYDDRLCVTSSVAREGKARLRFDVQIAHPDGRPVARGYTVHAVTGADGKPIRPPAWLVEAISG